MKNTVRMALYLFAAFLSSPARATTPDTDETAARLWQVDASKAGLSVGMDVRRFQDDFGLSGVVSSPAFGGPDRWFRFTLGGGVAWYPHGLSTTGQEQWDLFGHGRFGVEIGPPLQLGIPIRPYGFGGTQAIFLPNSLTDKDVAFGGFGGFGIEVAFMRGARSGPVTYYMEIGGAGFGARANKLPTNPDIASGLLLGAGFRAYL